MWGVPANLARPCDTETSALSRGPETVTAMGIAVATKAATSARESYPPVKSQRGRGNALPIFWAAVHRPDQSACTASLPLIDSGGTEAGNQYRSVVDVWAPGLMRSTVAGPNFRTSSKILRSS